MIDREKVRDAMLRTGINMGATIWPDDIGRAADTLADAAIAAVLEQLREPSDVMGVAGTNAYAFHTHHSFTTEDAAARQAAERVLGYHPNHGRAA
jgi:hypothetical protein